MDREKRSKNELIGHNHILNALFDWLYDLNNNTSSTKEIWDALESKYKSKQECTKKFLISGYFKFKFLENIHIFPERINYK